MHYCRLPNGRRKHLVNNKLNDDVASLPPLFLPSTTVVLQELTELLTCVLVLLYQRRGNIQQTMQYIQTQSNKINLIQTFIPGIIFLLRNILVMTSVGCIPVGIHQITYQSKLIVAALLSVCSLQMKLTVTQWTSILILFGGICSVQIDFTSASSFTSLNEEEKGKVHHQNESEQNTMSLTSNNNNRNDNYLFGIICAFMAATCSALGGVLTEKIMKGKKI